jgi:hypothetical protein
VSQANKTKSSYRVDGSSSIGVGICNCGSSSTVTKCILWDNSPEIFGVCIVEYSDVQGGWEGEGNIDTDPMFADAANGDLHLIPGSPCIDAGDNDAVPSGITTDLDGYARITGAYVDMGAYELNPVQLIADLIQDVVILNLQRGIANALDSKLDAVQRALEDVNENNDVAAINALGAFINEVEAQSGDKISEAEADALIEAAQSIIDFLMHG